MLSFQTTMDLHSHVIERHVNAKDYWKEASSRDINVMAITEHAHFHPKKAFEIVSATKPKDKILIPGIELNTTIGHVLLYAPTPHIYDEKKFLQIDLPIEEAATLAEKYNGILSCAHPWGFQHDSAAFLIGPKKLVRLVKKLDLGIEAYNGLVGHLSDIVLESSWIKKPAHFLGFLEKNRVTRNIGLARVSRVFQKRIEASIWNSLSRVNAGIELGKKASFITAGSDAHVAYRIGEGMLKIKHDAPITNTKEAFELIRQKDLVNWCGVGVRESAPGVFDKIKRTKIKRGEIWDGVKYATKRTITEKVWKKIKHKKKNGETP